jgi:hypothetical protein
MRLPVSGLEVGFRSPDGHDDLAILESWGSVIERALDALSRLANFVPEASPDAPGQSPWGLLTITDFEVALLSLRRSLFSDNVSYMVRCACSERMEIDFSVANLLSEITPRTPRHVEASTTRKGWFSLREKEVVFRLPVMTDQILALSSPDAYAVLKERCIEAKDPDVRTMTMVERAMEAMAPSVSRPITGACAACGASLHVQLHVPSLVAGELNASAASVHGEIHAIAATYHWDESRILSLPQLRRHAYTDAIRQGGAI